jgi:hypothetical protein
MSYNSLNLQQAGQFFTNTRRNERLSPSEIAMKWLPAFLVLVPLATLSIALHSQTNPAQNAPLPSASNSTDISPQRNLLRIGLASIYIADIPNLPFTATVIGEQEVSGGPKTWNRRLIARDSSGRIFQDQRDFTPDGLKSLRPPKLLIYIDPTQHKYYRCVTETRTCHRFPLPLSADGTTPPNWGLINGAGGIVSVAYTGPDVKPKSVGKANLQGLDTIAYQAKFKRKVAAYRVDYGDYDFINQEIDHPVVPINIAPTQVTQTITSEFWYSPELQAVLKLKYQIPLASQHPRDLNFPTPTHTSLFSVEDLNRTEPDPKLFTPPADYKVIDADWP